MYLGPPIKMRISCPKICPKRIKGKLLMQELSSINIEKQFLINSQGTQLPKYYVNQLFTNNADIKYAMG